MLTDTRLPTSLTDAELWRACIDASNLLGTATGYRWPGIWRHDYRPDCDLAYRPFGAMLALPQRPARRILEVLLDGDVLDPAGYRAERYYVRRIGHDENGISLRWPTTQDMSLAETEVGTWVVRYEWGVRPPPEAVSAAVEFATELMLARKGKECRLPSNVRSIDRETVSITFADISSYLARGNTGLFLVDYLLSQYPKPIRPPARVGRLPAERVRVDRGDSPYPVSWPGITGNYYGL